MISSFNQISCLRVCKSLAVNRTLFIVEMTLSGLLSFQIFSTTSYCFDEVSENSNYSMNLWSKNKPLMFAVDGDEAGGDGEKLRRRFAKN